MFKRVVVMTKDGLDSNIPVQTFLSGLAELLMRNAVMLYVNTLPTSSPSATEIRTLFVAIGGDGTMMDAMKKAALFNAPVIGFNLGKLGFLVENEFPTGDDGYTLLPYIQYVIFSGVGPEAFIEERMMIEGKLNGLPEPLFNQARVKGGEDWDSYIGPALNEILLSPNTLAAPFEYDIYINDKLVAHHNSSGIMVSTPTGSTAFSLSLGGPIMLPTATMMQVIPVAAHTLSARPVIVDGKDIVRIEIAPTTRIDSVDIIVDGRVVKTFPTTSLVSLTVGRAKQKAKIIHNEAWNFFDVLTQKLGWK